MNPSPLYSEKELLHRIADGDEQSFRSLFDRYKKRFYLVALKMTRSETAAQELVQDIFLKIWRSRTSLSNVENADSYLFTIAYREIYRYFKKLALNKKVHAILSASPLLQNTTDENIMARESERLINETVSRLPAQQQRVFMLSKLEGLNRKQIAEQLQISPNTVRNLLSDALKSIKSQLGYTTALFYLILLTGAG